MKLNIKDFINYWKIYYNEGKYPDKKYYYPYIKNLKKKDALYKLWHWKMGDPFFEMHKSKITPIVKYIDKIINLRKSNITFDSLYKFVSNFFKNSPVYLPFLIHICKPDDYPIFDQHVYRSFIFLTSGKIIKELKNIDIDDYLKYKNFVFKIKNDTNLSFRDIDKSLMAFGQFLKNPSKIINN